MLNKLFILITLVGISLFGVAFSAPDFRVERNIIPDSDNLYYFGTSTKVWKEGYFTNLYDLGGNKFSTSTGVSVAGNNGTFQYKSGSVLGGATEMVYNTSTQQTIWTAQSNISYGASQSVGGVKRMNLSNTTSAGFLIYFDDTQGANRAGDPLLINCASAGNPRQCVNIISHASTASALGVTGSSTDKGVIKATHSGTGTGYADAAALSLAINGNAQGFFMTQPSGATEATYLLNIGDDITRHLRLASTTGLQVNNKISGSSTLIIQGVTELRGQTNAQSVSSTNAEASGYGRFPTLTFTSASGTNIDLTGYLKINGDSVATSAVPIGNNGTIQFANSGALGGITEFVYNTSTQQSRFTAQTGLNYGSSRSTGGIVNITGTNTTSSLLVLFTNQGANMAGDPFVVNCINAANPRQCATIISVASSASALGVSGSSTDKGIVKVTHEGVSTGYADAAALSLQMNGNAQGIFITQSSGATESTFLLNVGDNTTRALQLASTTGLVVNKQFRLTSSSTFTGLITANLGITASGNFQLAASSSVLTPSIGGSALLAGQCSSATTTVDSTITSSTAAFVTTPRNDPGEDSWSYSFLSSAGLITTRVCVAAAGTPTATTYVVKIIK